MAAVVSACGGSPAPTGSHSTPPGTASSTSAAADKVTTPTVDPGHVVVPVAGISTTVPREVPDRPINPVIDAGQQIVITAQGFEPKRLDASDALPVMWTNLSNAPQQLVFVALPVRSKVIPVGGQFVWNAHGVALSVAYHSVSGLSGVVDFQTPGPS
jgi:hypothetical protein